MDSRSSGREELSRPQVLKFERNAEYPARFCCDKSNAEEGITTKEQSWS